jgi:hypothetical protein
MIEAILEHVRHRDELQVGGLYLQRIARGAGPTAAATDQHHADRRIFGRVNAWDRDAGKRRNRRDLTHAFAEFATRKCVVLLWVHEGSPEGTTKGQEQDCDSCTNAPTPHPPPAEY